MGKKVASYDELPDWFKNTDYLAADCFSDFDWYFHLKSRSFIHSIESVYDGTSPDAEYDDDYQPLNVWEEDTNKSSVDSIGALAHEQLRLLQTVQATPVSQLFPLSKLGPAFEHFDVFAARRWTRPISRITLFNLCVALWHLPRKLREDLIDVVQAHPKDLFNKIKKSAYYASWGDLAAIDLIRDRTKSKETGGELSKLFRIDIDIPDQQLIKDFKDFLSKCRAIEGIESSDTESAAKIRTQKWIDYGVLPYTDLQMWARQNGRTISSSFAAKALADHNAIRDPDFKFSAYTVDTTVKKYVGEALSEESLSIFQARASKEIENREKEFHAKVSKISQVETSGK